MTTPPLPPPPDLQAQFAALNPLVRGLIEPVLAPLLEYIAALQGQVTALTSQVETQQARGVELEAANADLRAQLQVKQERIDQLERQLYGRKSERTQVSDPKRAAQQERRKAKSKEEREAQRLAEREKNRLAREGLPVETHRIPLPPGTCCPACGGTDLRPLGEGERSVQYEWVPGRLIRKEYIREKAACTCKEGVVTAPPPPQVVDGGHYGPGLYAHVVVAKCMDVLPLHRQARAMTRLGVPLSVTQLCAMFHRAASLVAPVYKALLKRLPESRYLQADETTQPILEPGQVRKGWMWTFLDELSIVFVYDPSRGGKVPEVLLKGSQGSIVVDGHTGYNSVTTPDTRDRGGCWSHARRKLYEAHAYAPDLVDGLLLHIHDLYVIEQEALEDGFAGTRQHLRLRQRRSKPLLDKIFATLQANVGAFSPQSTIAKAMRYALNQRDALSLFLTDARIPIHNNASESALRIVALLRKNALFAGHDEGARNLAILLTMCATCHLHGVNPQQWFADALIRVSERGSTVEELLPWVWKDGRGRLPSPGPGG